ncbi:MAG: glycosyl-4,4'-diaponeurosporenoate acyltransferase [Chitinispirillia bacterium]
MRVFYFSNLVTAILDTVLWLIIHMAMAFGMTGISISLFSGEFFLFKDYTWEKNGKLYENLLGVTVWKNLIPDGAAWFSSGFSKKNLQKKDVAYFDRFVKETCRGELTHWLVILFAPLFFLFNPPWAGWIIIAYALCANLPCIIIQRYNRPRLKGVVKTMKRRLK